MPARRHGMSRTLLYDVYIAAKCRCTNPKDKRWKDYGGRGIKFLFTSFEQFYAELGPRPTGKSLDRFPNNDGDYEPGNVRWATQKEQGENRRNIKHAITHCVNGHKFTPENTYLYKDIRGCRVCRTNQDRAYRAKMKEDLCYCN